MADDRELRGRAERAVVTLERLYCRESAKAVRDLLAALDAAEREIERLRSAPTTEESVREWLATARDAAGAGEDGSCGGL